MKITLSKRGIEMVERMIEDLEHDDKTDICPDWWVYTGNDRMDSCDVCAKLFPLSHGAACPCYMYSDDIQFLINKLKEILKENKDGYK